MLIEMEPIPSSHQANRFLSVQAAKKILKSILMIPTFKAAQGSYHLGIAGCCDEI